MDNKQQGGRFTTWAFAMPAPFFFILALLMRPDTFFVVIMIYVSLVTSCFALILMPFEIRRAEKTAQKVAAWSLLVFNGVFFLTFGFLLIRGFLIPVP